MSFGRHLLELGMLESSDLERTQRHAEQSGVSLIVALRQLGIAESRDVAAAASQFYGVPLMSDEGWPTSLTFVGDISRSYLRAQKVVPLRILPDERLGLAVSDPENAMAIDAVRLATGRNPSLFVASLDDIEAALDRLTTGEVLPEDEIVESTSGDLTDDVEQLKDLALGAPVVRIVNKLLMDGLHTRATDIHIEPTAKRLLVRLRIDGVLREIRSPPRELGRAIISRIKILSGLDIAERRLPQDGRARIQVEGRSIDLRVATLQTVNGEAAAIRLLDNTQRALELSQLGFDQTAEAVLRRYLGAPHGLVLVTGPTGSGKTTTLAAALNILNQPTRKILTIEDPVEYQIDGINQIQLKPEIGITFSHALRAFLRHDPDVIMVGELRDTETARMAVQAALTGHLVLSTLHTNSAPGAVTRLLDMGVDGYLLASCLRCVIAQRLVRTLCQHCRKPVTSPIDLPGNALAGAGLVSGKPIGHWQAGGCERCFQSGFSGRTSVIEIVQFPDEVVSLIKPGVSTQAIAEAAMKSGSRPMIIDGIDKCLKGITTPEEVRRATLEV